MKYLLSIILSVLGGITGAYLFVHPLFGTTITTINGTDLLSNFPSSYNTTITNLNNDKIEVSTTSVASITTLSNLATVGTIISGIWNGSNIGTAYGGTGSTTLSSNQVLVGNGTGNIGVVSGWGTSGQLLTSGGLGSLPTWSSASFDTTQSYNLTGTYLGIKNLYASSTVANPLTLNTVAYSFPSSQGGANTYLQNDGSGALTWGVPSPRSLIGTIDVTTTGGTATSTLLGVPASFMTASSTIDVYGSLTCQANSGVCTTKIVNSTGAPFVSFSTVANSVTSQLDFHAIIYPNYSVSLQKTIVHGAEIQTSGTLASSNFVGHAEESTSSFGLSSAFSVGINITATNGSGVATLTNYAIKATQ